MWEKLSEIRSQLGIGRSAHAALEWQRAVRASLARPHGKRRGAEGAEGAESLLPPPRVILSHDSVPPYSSATIARCTARCNMWLQAKTRDMGRVAAVASRGASVRDWPHHSCLVRPIALLSRSLLLWRQRVSLLPHLLAGRFTSRRPRARARRVLVATHRPLQHDSRGIQNSP